MSKYWLIEPRDSLIVRDGKPFGAAAGNLADSLAFPLPSTTTGVVRTRAGLATIENDLSRFSKELGDEVQREITVTGSVLIEMDDLGKTELLLPAPADAAVHKIDDERGGKVVPLRPLESGSEVLTDLDENGLKLVGLVAARKEKPHPGAPKFWRWNKYEEWLAEPKTAEIADLEELGIAGLEKDRRVHIQMKNESKSGTDGGLFETRGLEFFRRLHPRGNEAISFRRYGLLVRVDTNGFSGEIKPGLVPLGGERRLTAWRETDISFPPIPGRIKEQIVGNAACRLLLLSPAIFKKGFLPGFDNELGVEVRIESVAVSRYQVISGWDFKIRKPKPTRRLCPAGSVYFLRLKGDEDSIRKWVDRVWFETVSDDPQDRKDGFGLAVLGKWDGSCVAYEEALRI